MATFVAVGKVDDVPEGRGVTFKIDGRDVAVFRVDDDFFAIDDTCIHAGSSLGAGKLSGKFVTCPGHGMRFDVTTGEVASGGLRVGSYAVKVVEGDILVEVP
jgi:3-phenylpropionate/trans-cinnamate dioxygenase ferredoxin component